MPAGWKARPGLRLFQKESPLISCRVGCTLWQSAVSKMEFTISKFSRNNLRLKAPESCGPFRPLSAGLRAPPEKSWNLASLTQAAGYFLPTLYIHSKKPPLGIIIAKAGLYLQAYQNHYH